MGAKTKLANQQSKPRNEAWYISQMRELAKAFREDAAAELEDAESEPEGRRAVLRGRADSLEYAALSIERILKGKTFTQDFLDRAKSARYA